MSDTAAACEHRWKADPLRVLAVGGLRLRLAVCCLCGEVRTFRHSAAHTVPTLADPSAWPDVPSAALDELQVVA